MPTDAPAPRPPPAPPTRTPAGHAVDPYTEIARATASPASSAGDYSVQIRVVRAYAQLGLMSAARSAAAASGLPAAQRDALLAELTGDDVRLPWSGFAAAFRANLAAFDARTALGAAVEAAWRSAASRLQLLRTRDGNFQVFSRLSAHAGWLPGLLPHNGLADAEALRAGWQGRVIRTLAVNGVGLGHVALAAIRASRETFLDFSPRVLLLEPSLLAWAVVLHLHDWTAVLADPRVVPLTGEDALIRFGQLISDPDRAVPHVMINGAVWPHSPGDAQIASLVRTEEERRDRIRAVHFTAAQAAYAGHTRAALATRFAEAAAGRIALRILGVTSRYTTVLQYTMRDLLAAFRGHGHATELYIEPDSNAHFSPVRLAETVAAQQPDLVVLIDHLHREFAGVIPEQTPVLCWIQDQLPHLFNEQAGREVRPLEFVCGHGFPECITTLHYPPDRFLPAAIPTDPAALLDPHETDADLAPYRCDVMFATNATHTPEQIAARFCERAPQAARPILHAAFDTLRSVMNQPWFCGDFNYARLLEQCERDVGRTVTHSGYRAEIVDALRRVADQTLRERVVRWAAAWADASGRRLRLYGRGWDARPEFARFAAGFVPHGPLLGRAFRGARVSLHAGVNPAIHQRVLDGLCAGGFFLIAEKPIDTTHAVSCAIHAYYQRTAPSLPFEMRPDLLPPREAESYRRSMWLRGLDPARSADVNHLEEVLNLDLYCRRRLLHTASGLWPRFGEVTFHTREEFVARLEHFLHDDDHRSTLAAEMRAAVIAERTYSAFAARLLRFIAEGLAGAWTPIAVQTPRRT